MGAAGIQRRGIATALMVCALAVWAGGCASTGASGPAPASGGGPRRGDRSRDVAGGPEIALRRGSAWSTLTVMPPRIVGPTANMVIKDGVLSGALGGAGLHVVITSDGAEGFGPSGSVALSLSSEADGAEVSGTWNGYRVHLTFTDSAVTGSVVQAMSSMTIDPRRRPGLPTTLGGGTRQAGVSDYSTCEYTLTERQKDGALTGTSTCTGMPEPTRLEVPSVVRAYLTRSELVVVLVALLSSPPTVSSEAIAPPG